MIMEMVRRASRWRRGTAHIACMGGRCGRYEALRRPSEVRDAIVRVSTRWRQFVIYRSRLTRAVDCCLT